MEKREDRGCVVLARLMEVSPQTWRNWVLGKSVPPRRKAHHLAVLLGTPALSPDEIVRLIDEDRVELAARRRAEGLHTEPTTSMTRRVATLPPVAGVEP